MADKICQFDQIKTKNNFNFKKVFTELTKNKGNIKWK